MRRTIKVGPRAVNADPVAPRVVAPGASGNLPIQAVAFLARQDRPLEAGTRDLEEVVE